MKESLVARIFLLSPTQIAGHVFDRQAPDRRLVVELLIDGLPAGLARADIHDPDLAAEGGGDGCYGFVFTLDAQVLSSARQAEVRLANTAEALAAPLRLGAVVPDYAQARMEGRVSWLGGLRLNGWLATGAPEGARVRASVDGQLVAECVAGHWAHAGEGHAAAPVRGFDLYLPEKFADGCAHLARVFDDAGAELPGSPCAFAAFADGLENYVAARADIRSERFRAALFDRLTPQSFPFAQFSRWRERFPNARTAEGAAPKIAVALIGCRDLETSAQSLEAQRGCEWVAAALDGGASETEFPNAALREFLDGDAAGCDFVVFAPSGACFQEGALAALAAALAACPAAAIAYADFSVVASDGGEWPAALPAFDYERLLEQGAGALFFAARFAQARAAAAAGADTLFRLFNFTQDGRRARGPRQSAPLASGPVHVPGFYARLPRLDPVAATQALVRANAAHFERRGAAAEAAPAEGALFPAARITRAQPRAKVSVLVPTRDRVDLLQPCLDSLFATVDVAAHEIIVLDNDSCDPETRAYFEEIAGRGVRIETVPGPFNFPKLVNAGAAAATGEFLLLLNNDVEALEKGWFEDMLGRMAEPDVGAVGAMLLWPSGVVQHGGVVLGPSFDASHAFNDRIDGDPGYGDLLRVAHEVSAATAACLMTDRALFLDVGGFDGVNFPINYNDVDYCLKLRARGLRIVQTPHAKLLHRQSASRGFDLRADQKDRFQREMRNLRAIWGDALMADPCYNPLLSLDVIPYSGLAWPPLPAKPRQNFSPPPRRAPPGF